jgi:uncharacterized membrane protein YuzA (DUF378 family)
MGKFLSWIAYFFSAIGAINWGLVAFLKFNLVEYIDKLIPNIGLSLIIYAVVAVSGFYALLALFRGYA